MAKKCAGVLHTRQGGQRTICRCRLGIKFGCLVAERHEKGVLNESFS
jgi:hypothetical protein